MEVRAVLLLQAFQFAKNSRLKPDTTNTNVISDDGTSQSLVGAFAVVSHITAASPKGGSAEHLLGSSRKSHARAVAGSRSHRIVGV
jgi:hypothetical protein